MIDHPDQVERLMDRLSAALPIPARVTPEVQMSLRNQRDVVMPARCSITCVSYAGDEGGTCAASRLKMKRLRRYLPPSPISGSIRASSSRATSSPTRSTA